MPAGRKKDLSYQRKIISLLRNNSRIQSIKIAKKVKKPLTSVIRRIEELEKDIIIKYCSIIDFPLSGYPFSAFVVFSCSHKNKVIQFVCGSNFVNNFYRISGGHDFFLEVVMKNPKYLDDFIEDLKLLGCENIKFFGIVECLEKEKKKS